MRDYNANRYRKYGKDTLYNRLQAEYDDLPTACECCGEARVVEIAHKPEFSRNGRWRVLSLYKRHMFWILCPTCHKVLDKRIETPEQMGLS